MTESVGPSDRLSDAQVQMIVDRLNAKGVNGRCPRCSNNQFVIESTIILHSTQGSLGGIVLGGRSIPVAVTICDNCGWVSEHALGALGLLENEEFLREGSR